jgi:hypothetical protein
VKDVLFDADGFEDLAWWFEKIAGLHFASSG